MVNYEQGYILGIFRLITHTLTVHTEGLHTWSHKIGPAVQKQTGNRLYVQ